MKWRTVKLRVRMCVCRCVNSPEARTVLSEGVQDGVCDIGTARHTQGLQAVTTPANCDEALVCDLLLTEKRKCVFGEDNVYAEKENETFHQVFQMFWKGMFFRYNWITGVRTKPLICSLILPETEKMTIIYVGRLINDK